MFRVQQILGKQRFWPPKDFGPVKILPFLTFSRHPLYNLQTLSLCPVGTNQRPSRSPQDTLQVTSRHPSDTLQMPSRHPQDTHQFSGSLLHKLRQMIRRWVGRLRSLWVGSSHLDNRATLWPNLQAQKKRKKKKKFRPPLGVFDTFPKP